MGIRIKNRDHNFKLTTIINEPMLKIIKTPYTNKHWSR